MAYAVKLTAAALRMLERMSRSDRRRAVAAIDGLADEPRPSGVVKLAGRKSTWRIRVGDYRILYEIHGGQLLVLVVKIGHRRDVYQ